MDLREGEKIVDTKPCPRDFVRYYIRKHGSLNEHYEVDVDRIMFGVKMYVTRIVACISLFVLITSMVASGSYDVMTCASAGIFIAFVIFFGTHTRFSDVDKKFIHSITSAVLEFFWCFRIWILSDRKNYFSIRRDVENVIVGILIKTIRFELDKPESLDECARHQDLLDGARYRYDLANNFFKTAPFAELYGRARDCYLKTSRMLNREK